MEQPTRLLQAEAEQPRRAEAERPTVFVESIPIPKDDNELFFLKHLPDGRLFACNDSFEFCLFQLWDNNNGYSVEEKQFHLNSIDVCQNTAVMSIEDDFGRHRLELYNFATKETTLLVKNRDFGLVAISPDGQYIIAHERKGEMENDSRLICLHCANGKWQKTWAKHTKHTESNMVQEIIFMQDVVATLNMYQSDKSNTIQIQILNLETGEVTQEFGQDIGYNWSLLFHPTNSGCYLYTINKRGKIQVWDSVAGCLLKVLEEPAGINVMATDLALSNNNKYLVSANDNGTITVWDTSLFFLPKRN